MAPVEDSHFGFHELGVLGEDETDQPLALRCEAHEENPPVGTLAEHARSNPADARGTAGVDAAHAHEAIDDLRNVLPGAVKLVADGLFVLRAVVEKRGQETKLKGGKVEHGELAAHRLGEVRGGLAEVEVGGEGAHRLALGVVIGRSAPLAALRRRVRRARQAFAA